MPAALPGAGGLTPQPTTPRRFSFSLGQPRPSAPRPPLGRLSPKKRAARATSLRARAAPPPRAATSPPRAPPREPPPRRVEAMGGGASTPVAPAPDNQRQRQTSDALNQMPVETLQEVVTVRSRLSRIRLSFIRPSLSPPEDGTGLLPQMRKILENDGDLLDFTNFLMREFADEPLQFYAAIADFTAQFGTPTERKRGMVELPRRFTTVEEGPEDDVVEEVVDSKTEARQAAAREIFDEFLATDAPRQVHVPAKMRKALKKELDAGLCLPAVFRPALGEVLTALARDKLVPFVTHQRNDKKIWIRVLRILESSVASEKRQSFRGGAPKPDPASPGRARQPTMATVPKKRFDHRRLSVDVRMVVARELDLEELRKKHAAATKA